MKKYSLVFGVALLVSLLISQSAISAESAQAVTQNIALTVDGSALLAVFGTGEADNGEDNTVAMSLSGAGVAGAEVMTSAEDASTRLRISSLVENGKTRTISASILPDLNGTGTSLSLTLSNPNTFLPQPANGGVTTGEQNVTDGTSKDLMTGITTCWSGVDYGDGYVIKYTYRKVEGAVALLSRSTVVTFTIGGEI